MKNEDKITVAKITRVYGVKGWLKIVSFTDPTDAIIQYSPWFIKRKSELAEIEPIAIKSHQDGFIVKFADCDDRNVAQEWVGLEVNIRKNQLPQLAKDDYYWHELEGLKVLTTQNEILGTIDHLFATGSNDVLVVKPTEGSIDQRERLIPYLFDQVVKQIDVENNRIYVDWDKDF